MHDTKEQWVIPFNAFELFQERKTAFKALAEELEVTPPTLRRWVLRTECPLSVFKAVVAIVAPDQARALLDGRYVERTAFPVQVSDTVLRAAAKFDALASGAMIPTKTKGIQLTIQTPPKELVEAADRTIALMDVTSDEHRDRVRLSPETSEHMANVEKLLAKHSTNFRPGRKPKDLEAPKAAVPAVPAVPAVSVVPADEATGAVDVLVAVLTRVQNQRDQALAKLAQTERKLAAAERSKSELAARLDTLASANGELQQRLDKLEAETEIYETLLEREEIPIPPVPAAAVAAVEKVLKTANPLLLLDLEKLPKTTGYAS
jgi:hypothetical protein